MGTIETFDHTADVGLRVTGRDWNDLFETAATGMFDYIVANRSEIQIEEVEKVSLQAESIGDLLAAWLGELIFRSEILHRVYRDFEVLIEVDHLRLDATIKGERIDADRHVLDHEVKAVTRHGLVIQERAGICFAELILDI
jgi:SHS2 domain-containing protein